MRLPELVHSFVKRLAVHGDSANTSRLPSDPGDTPTRPSKPDPKFCLLLDPWRPISPAFAEFLRAVAPLVAAAVGALLVRVNAFGQLDSNSYATLATIIPVILVALAIDARMRPIPRSAPRWLIATHGMYVLFFFLLLTGGEIVSLVQAFGTEPGGSSLNWIPFGAVVGGFLAIGVNFVIRDLGTHVPIHAALCGIGEDKSNWLFLLRLGFSNEHATRNVEPLLNFLVPEEVTLNLCDRSGDPPDDPADVILETHDETLPGVQEWRYASRQLGISGGDSLVLYYRLEVSKITTMRKMPIIVRIDDQSIRRGREQLVAELSNVVGPFGTLPDGKFRRTEIVAESCPDLGTEPIYGAPSNLGWQITKPPQEAPLRDRFGAPLRRRPARIGASVNKQEKEIHRRR